MPRSTKGSKKDTQPSTGKIEKKSKKEDKKGPKKGVEKVLSAIPAAKVEKAPSKVEATKQSSKKDQANKAQNNKEKKNGGKKQESNKKQNKKETKKVSSSSSDYSSSSESSDEKMDVATKKVTETKKESSSSGSSSGSYSSSSASGSSSSGSGSGSSSSASSGSSSGDSDESSSEEKKEVKQNKRKAPEPETSTPTKKQKTDSTPAAAGGNENTRVVIDNLVFTITDEDVHKFFADCGTITKIAWIENATGRFAGKGTITFETAEAAQAALAKAGSDLLGRALRTNAPPAPNSTLVITQVPDGASEDDFRNAFKDCGNIISVRLSVHKPICFVEFDTLDAGKKAFALSETGFTIKGKPVTVDYAFDQANRPQTPRQDNFARGNARGGQGGRGGRGGQGGRSPGGNRPSTPKPDGGCTLFAGGLPFNIEESDIHNAFSGQSISNVRWVEKDGEFKGVAFIEFADTHAADKAMEKAKQGINIKGRDARFDWAADRRK